MIKIAICDDEAAYLNRIVVSVKKILDKKGVSTYLVDTYSSGEELLADSRLFGYNVIFLDMNMHGITGLEVAEKIRESSQEILLVFVTAFLDYAIEGYRMEVTRFLVKDMLEEMLPECLEAIIRKLALQAYKMNKQFVEGKKVIYADCIWYVESRGHKLIFHVFETKAVQYSLYDKLDNIEKELQEYHFLRVHKSFLVNTKYIDGIKNYRVYLKNGDTLPIPKEKFQKVKERYYEILGDMI